MNPVTKPETKEIDVSSIVQQLLNQISELLKAEQNAGALCNFYYVLHMAERGFLKKAEIIMLAKRQMEILALLDKAKQLNLCERLIKILEMFNLYDEKVDVEGGLFEFKQNKDSLASKVNFVEPDSKNYDRHTDALKHAVSVRQTLVHLTKDKRQAVEIENAARFNTLEALCQYDLLVPIYIRQLRECRHEGQKKILDTLKRAFEFAKISQKHGVYAQAQTLYYRILETLSTQQSFYEKTCLKDIDERFLLEGLLELQETCLGKCCVQSEKNYFWSDNFAAIQQLRIEKKEAVDTLMINIDEVRYTPELIESVENLQAKITQSMKTFFASLLKQAESLLGVPPCDYCLIALGSIARGDATPFSDLESVLLVEKPCPKGRLEALYFEHLWKLFAFQVQALGESYGENPGFHIDTECYPLLQDSGLINTPEGIIERYGLRTITASEHAEGRLALTLLNSTVVYSHEGEDKTETLWERYHRLLNELLGVDEILRKEKACEQLRSATTDFDQQSLLDFDEGCSIKKAFLGPLTYLLCDFAFYHHLDEPNNSEILKCLADKKILDSEFANHCRAAIAELNLWRLYTHFNTQTQKDILTSELPAYQQERLKQLWRGLIKSLYLAKDLLAQANPACCHPVFNNFSELKYFKDVSIEVQYLLYAQSPLLPFDAFIAVYHKLPVSLRYEFLDQLNRIKSWGPNDNWRVQTLEILEAQSNPDGWQPRMDKERREWEETLKDLLAPKQMQKTTSAQVMFYGTVLVYLPEYMEGTATYHSKAHQLNTMICQQLFDVEGKLKTKLNTQPGRHLVLKVNYDNRSLWFKFFPEQAGTEFAVNRLDRYLGNQGTPMTKIVKLKRLEEPQGMAVQISDHAPGLTIENCLEHHPDHITRIDKASFTRTLLRVLLTNPEDDKGDDYFLVPMGTQFFLMRIDNERAYYQPDAAGRRFTKTRYLQVKSILYCLNQMQEPLDEDTLNAFLRLDTYAMLERWLNELKEEHGYYAALFNEDEIKSHFNHKQPGPSILGIPMASGLVRELLTRLDSMQQVIQLIKERRQQIIGMDLLKVVQPKLAEYYEKAFVVHPLCEAAQGSFPSEQAACVLNRFNMVTTGLYDITDGGYKQSTYPTIKAVSQSLRLKTELTERQVLYISKGSHMSPVQALKELNQLQGTLVEAVEHALLEEQKDSISDFKQLAVRNQLLVIDSIIERSRLKDKLSFTDEQLRHVLKAMVGIRFHRLTLSAFKGILTDALLMPILSGAGKYLIFLNIDDCWQLTSSTLKNIAYCCPNLETLTMQNIDNKQDYFLGQWYKLITIDNVSFPNLKRLGISGCKQLTHVNIRAPALEILIAERCTQLQSVKTESSNLLAVDFTKCDSLTEVGIATLSKLPGMLFQFKAAACDQLIFSDFRAFCPYFASLSLGDLTTKEAVLLKQGIGDLLNDPSNDKSSFNDDVKDLWIQAMRTWLVHKNKLLIELLQLLQQSLEDKDKFVRAGAAVALGEFAQAAPEYNTELLEFLKLSFEDKEECVRQGVCETLDLFAQAVPEYIPTLLKYLELALLDKNGDVRRQAGKIRDGEWAYQNVTETFKRIDHECFFGGRVKVRLEDESKKMGQDANEDKEFGEFTQVVFKDIMTYMKVLKEQLQSKKENVRKNASWTIGRLAKALSTHGLLANFKLAIQDQCLSEEQDTNFQETKLLDTGKVKLNVSFLPLIPNALELYGTSERTINDRNLANMQFANVETINLSKNQITGEGAHILCQALLSIISLKKLDLWNNPLGDEGAADIGNLLAQHASLKQLTINETQLTVRGAQAIAKGLTENIALEFLDIGYNAIGDEGAFAIAAALKRHLKFSNLRVGGAGLTEIGGKVLFELVRVNTGITDIDLNNNSIPDDLHKAILQTVEENREKQEIEKENLAINESYFDDAEVKADKSDEEINVKIMMVGEADKSHLAIQFVSEFGQESFDPTFEDAFSKRINIDGRDIMIAITYEAGTEQYTAVRDSYMQNAQIFMLGYSITSRATFDALTNLRAQVLRVKDKDEFPMVIVGNKCDLENQREVTTEEGQELANKFNCPFFECSIKTGENVERAFHEAARLVLVDRGLIITPKPLQAETTSSTLGYEQHGLLGSNNQEMTSVVPAIDRIKYKR